MELVTPPARTIWVLHLEDSRIDHELVKFSLRRNGTDFRLQRVETLDEFASELASGRYDVVLADWQLQGFNARDAWDRTHDQHPDVPWVMLSGAVGETLAVRAIQAGMSDYVLKDALHRLEFVLLRAIEMARAEQAKRTAEQARQLSQQQLADLSVHVQETLEDERVEIAREVHDDIGGALAAVKMDIAWVRRQPVDEACAKHLDSALEMLEHAIGASRRIMKSLRPAVLDQGLSAAVAWLLENFQRRSGVSVALTTRGELRGLPPEVLQAAFRTVQEALTNVAKHAQATQVTVDLSDAGGSLTVEVRDNGVGLGDGARGKTDSYGLRGLAERAERVGGWLDVASAPGATSVILTIPLQATGSTDGGNKAPNPGQETRS